MGRMFRTTALLAAALCLVAAGAAAQDTLHGVLRGTITAKKSGAPVEGVVVTARGESGELFARSDAEGDFTIELAPGLYDVRFAHPQFDERVFEDVEVVPGKVSEADIELDRGDEPGAEGGAASGPPGVEEIVVTGQAMESTLDQARFSDSVLDVLSSDDFAVTGDSDVVDALARVTGITIVDDKYVYVRGLGERYSSTLFNGALLPSPDPARRVVPLDLFPSGVMEQLSIQKTYSPSLPGDFSGGSLQMTTRRIPSESEGRLNFSVEYNTETTFKDVDWNKGDDLDWTGFEGGFRDFPREIADATDPATGRIPAADELTAEQLETLGRSLDRSFETEEITVAPNFGLDASYGRTVETAEIGSLGFLAGLRYKNDWATTEEIRRTSEPGSVNGIGDDFLQDETQNTIGYSALGATEWNPIAGQMLRGTFFWTRLTDKRAIVDTGSFATNDRTVEDTTWEYEERQLVTTQLVGDHFFVALADLGVNWGVTYSQATRDKPNSQFFEYELDLDTGEFVFANEASGNGWQWEVLQDDAWDLFLDTEIPYRFNDDLATTLKLGTKYFTKDRESDLRRFRFTPRFSSEDFEEVRRGSPDEVFDDDNIGDGGWEIQDITNFTDSYNAEENIVAGYLETDTEIGDSLRIMLGLRYEDSEQITETRAVSGGLPVKTNLSEAYALPAFSLTWSFRDDMQLRTAVSQTLNRPDIREISPATYLDPESRNIYQGNPNLEIAEIINVDLAWEWYYSDLDFLEVGTFFKDFTSPIEETLLLQGSSVRRTYENAESAILYGIEASTRQGLYVLSDWTRDFYVKVNAAVMTSDVEVASTATQQTNQSRRLQGQSDWVVNTQLTWDNLPRDIQATVAFNMFGDRIYDVGVNGLDDAIEEPYPILDFNYRQGFDLWGQPFLFKFQAKNLIDPDRTVDRDGVTEREYNTGRSFKVALEWEF